MNRNITFVVRLVWIAVAAHCWVSGVSAQNQLTQLEGELVGVRGQLMQVKGSDMKMYLVLMPPDAAQVQYSGTALPTWLRQGMFIRFSGTFDDRGISKEPITEIHAFTPDKRRAQPNQLTDTTPGIYPLGGGDELFGGDAAKQKKPAARKYRIVGQVAGIGRKGELGVMTAPRQVVQVQVTDETKVILSMQGVQFAMPGDKVSVDGYFNPPAETNITANSIRIAAADLLGKEPEKPVRKTARQRREEAAATQAEAAQPADKTEPEASDKPADAEPDAAP